MSKSSSRSSFFAKNCTTEKIKAFSGKGQNSYSFKQIQMKLTRVYFSALILIILNLNFSFEKQRVNCKKSTVGTSKMPLVNKEIDEFARNIGTVNFPLTLGARFFICILFIIC